MFNYVIETIQISLTYTRNLSQKELSKNSNLDLNEKQIISNDNGSYAVWTVQAANPYGRYNFVGA